MSAMLPARRVSLASTYRDRSETEIRARLDGDLPDSERVVARAELLRRGLGSDAQDTAPATGFEPTAFPDPFAVQSVEPQAAAPAAPRRGGRTWLVAVLLVVIAAGGALAWAVRMGLVKLPHH